MNSIKDIISQVIMDITTRAPDKQVKVQRLWDSVIDEKTRQHVVILGFKEGVLEVVVDSPAWRFQMNLKRRNILDQLKEDLPELQDISFKIGKVK